MSDPNFSLWILFLMSTVPIACCCRMNSNESLPQQSHMTVWLLLQTELPRISRVQHIMGNLAIVPLVAVDKGEVEAGLSAITAMFMVTHAKLAGLSMAILQVSKDMGAVKARAVLLQMGLSTNSSELKLLPRLMQYLDQILMLLMLVLLHRFFLLSLSNNINSCSLF